MGDARWSHLVDHRVDDTLEQLPDGSGATTTRRPTDDEQHPFRQFAREAREGLSFVAERPLLIKSIIYLTLATTTYLMIAALGPEDITNVLA